jgi:hypothetical protein
MQKRYRLWLIVFFILSLSMLASCGGDDEGKTPEGSADLPPTVEITTPTDGSVLPAGQAVAVSVLATDDKGISRIELYVDSSLIESRVTPAGSEFTTVSEAFTWSASIIGSHSLQARAYDTAGQLGASRFVGVEVQLPGSSGSLDNTPLPEVTLPPGGEAPTPIPPTEPPAPPTEELAQVRANVDANVRNGPGTNYTVVGLLAEGGTAPVTGRNADSSWWQINYEGSTAWIADSVATANAAARSVPVASAPPPPPPPPTNTPAPPPSLPTAPPPTAPPAPSTGLWADQTSLNAGQCTTLHWDYSGNKAVYISLAYGADKDQRPVTGSEQVCPSVTTTFAATVVMQDSSQQFPSLTIGVGGGGCGDPYITRFVPTTDKVSAGEPFSIFWEVDCAKTVHFIQVGSYEQPVGGHDKKIDVKINQDTVFQLRVGKNNGGSVNTSFTVKIRN